MVTAYVAMDRDRSDQSRSRDVIGVDDPVTLSTEWARHVAWRAEGRLNSLIEGVPFGASRDEVIAKLESAIEDVTQAIDDMRAGQCAPHHYEQGPATRA